jgi:NDP-sugar pyrophosphorylase family protein
VQCVILAGGLGTRMWPETRKVPKTLLPIAGRPFAFWQLQWLAGAGITSIIYSIGHLGSPIRDYVGSGAAWGVHVEYVDEGTQLLGTAGALRHALAQDVLAENFLVLYGDSWLQVDPSDVLRTARRVPEPALMTVFENDGRWDGSNVIFDGTRVVQYAKGLTNRPAEMRWIDYGLLAFDRQVIADRIPPDRPSDLAPLCAALADDGALAGYLVTRRFYEIGSPAGWAELDGLLSRGGLTARRTIGSE